MIFERNATKWVCRQKIGNRWSRAFDVLAVGLIREEEMQIFLSIIREAWHSALLRIDSARLRRQGKHLGHVDRSG
ncbi:hypothetical protein [Allomesorhizobium camelthorni]|uniref:Uncharacterized protein n=1 Tax=Allomesorhizobium camelthorni TaxID=475069 RepID=A0A6G4WJV2_9HYPH|nr:hypothetical protein [Mesorhizobium camelthorni]NGO55082.1 hypothetical protein [Mesorhizobium camelthorni]